MYHSQPADINDLNTIPLKKNFKELQANGLFFETIMIQKYKSNKGRYVYHNDFSSESDQKRYRVLTYIYYLNDVDEGGETQFWDNYKVNPQKGKLVLFPASWTYPHSGLMPISHDKYIITGWIYTNSDG
jgi:Rps23 Pro-64 3,4-dihydroxylase Tpa1-like proline 4-hydroxylase